MSGDRETAVNSSRMAYILNNIALGVGIAVIIICIIVGIQKNLNQRTARTQRARRQREQEKGKLQQKMGLNKSSPQQFVQGVQLVPQAPIAVQPMVYVSPTPPARPMPDYLCYSIFTMLCCCLPLGIVALVYSISTRNANMSGQHQAAEHSSRKARNFNHAAVGIALTFVVLGLIYEFVLK